MPKKYIKKCLLNIPCLQEITIKTTLWFYFPPVRTAKINKTSNWWWEFWVRVTLIHWWWVVISLQSLWNQYGRSPQTWELVYLKIQLFGIVLEDASSSHRDTCSIMFILVFFGVARNQRKPRRPSTEQWIRKM